MNTIEAGILGGAAIFAAMFLVLVLVILKYEKRLDDAERRSW